MKAIFCVLILIGFSAAQAATIEDGRYNSMNDSIEISVSYAGGCEKHSFSLELLQCYEMADPMFCEVDLEHDSNGDMCEALISERLKFPVSEYGFDDPRFDGALLIITSEDKSQALIKIPKRN